MKKSIIIDHPLLKQIGAVADARHLEVYVVGGYVRDILRGKPGKDIDIVVMGNGVSFATAVSKELRRDTLVVFPKFGTAMLQLDEGRVEFVGARKESYDRQSRKPSVETGSLDDDLSRRDFTVNAVAASLNAGSFGRIEDPFGGQKDIQKGILKTPRDPKETFDDDPLRIMRAMRFASQLGFTIEGDVLAAAEKMKERIGIVSQERIADEFLKLMASPHPSIGLKLLYETRVMEIVFPEVARLAGVDQRREHHHKDVFLHTLQVVDNVSEVTDNVWLRMTALLHDIAKPKTKDFKEGVGWTFHGHEEIGARMVKGIFRRMKFPLDHVPYIEKLVRLHLRPMALVDQEVTDSAVRRLLFEAGEEIDDLMVLCRADITSKNPRLVSKVRDNYDRVARKMAEVEEKDRMRNWQPALRGDEIMKICRIESGPLVGKLKQAVVDAILDGIIPNEHNAAVQYLMHVKEEILSGQRKPT